MAITVNNMKHFMRIMLAMLSLLTHNLSAPFFALLLPVSVQAYHPPVPPSLNRRKALEQAFVGSFPSVFGASSFLAQPAWADEDAASLATSVPPVLLQVSGDAKKLVSEGRAYESQGNMLAAQRVYNKVTLIAPRFVYGWSNLGNTQTALGDLNAAELSYTKAIDLCQEIEQQPNGQKCKDLYLLLLNRGSIRLNNDMVKESLQDLGRADSLRGRPDPLILQNLARSKELNGLYREADRDYAAAIGLSSNEVNPFWLRAALVKYELGDLKGAYDLAQRVENRFPEAPEVRAAYAVLLAARGDAVAGQRKFLEIPDRQRLKYSDAAYLTKTVAWPPAMRRDLATITEAVGDTRRLSAN